MRHVDLADADCAIAQALGVVGDWWTLLVIRDIAGGSHRFDDLHRALGVSRNVLTLRLKALAEQGVVERRQYSERPPRFAYHLTDKGRGLLPVLIALQDWGTRHVMGDGTLTASSAPDSREARRVHDLVDLRVPEVALADVTDALVDPVADGSWTVLYLFPGAEAPDARFYPPGWGEIPGAAGCTLEATTYRDRHADFVAAARVVGVSTQRPDQLAAFGEYADLPYPLLSDETLELATALRLPTFRAGGESRFKRLTLVIDPSRMIRGVLFPITDPAGSVQDALDLLTAAISADASASTAPSPRP